jgi:hypothetical protein
LSSPNCPSPHNNNSPLKNYIEAKAGFDFSVLSLHADKLKNKHTRINIFFECFISLIFLIFIMVHDFYYWAQLLLAQTMISISITP